MKRWLFAFLFLVVLATYNRISWTFTPEPMTEDVGLEDVGQLARRAIRAATVQIGVELMPDAAGNVRYLRGLGTLVQRDGRLAVLTHNHWSFEWAQVARVTLRDADNVVLMTLDGAAARTLMGHTDPGVRVFAAPPGWPAVLHQRHVPMVVPVADVPIGASVAVVRRVGPKRNYVHMTTASVVAVERFRGQVVLHVMYSDGTPVQPGDSGGGVWYKNRLVAATWARWADDRILVAAGLPLVGAFAPAPLLVAPAAPTPTFAARPPRL